MKVLVLTSGGDAPGMNAVVHYLTKMLTRKKHEVFASLYGFQGLLDDKIIKLNTFLTKQHKNKAGCFIKSSRCLEFRREKGQKKALETLEKHSIDLIIIIGGDGSFEGGKALINLGKKVVFLPATIDKDLHYNTYSIGFDTATHACENYIKNVQPTMQAFDRVCIYEIMGRENPSLTNEVAKKVKADLVINIENKNQINWKDFKQSYKENPVKIVLLQEKILPINYVEELIENITDGGGVRSCVIGYVQRGTNPTKNELKNAKLFAKETKNMLKLNIFNRAIALVDGKTKNIEYK